MSGLQNPAEHHATVDAKPGLKMKIKRKNVGATKTTAAEVKHEIIKPEMSGSGGGNNPGGSGETTTPEGGSGLPSPLDRLKQALAEKDRSGVKGGRGGSHKKEKGGSGGRDKNSRESGGSYPGAPPSSAPSDRLAQDGLVAGVHIKRELQTDPYEFNAKVEDRHPDPGPLPATKKIKVEKMDAPSTFTASSAPGDPGTMPPPHSAMHTLGTAWGRRDVGVETSSIGVVTDPDCLGPCEPGTHVVLEGIVWNETPNGILVVNVTWRGKTYVGTLMDATRHDWAPPRFNDDSPTNEVDSRTPKGRGKRGRAAATTPVSESCTVGERRLRKTRGRMGSNNTPGSAAAQPPSPGKADTANKRKGRPPEQELGADGPRGNKRGRGGRADTPGADNLIECPEPNCSKKYRHVNGLRYHLTHSHKKNLIFDSDGSMVTESTENFVKPAPVSAKDSGRNSPKVKNGRRAVDSKCAAASPRKLDEDSEPSKVASPRKTGDGDADGKKAAKKPGDIHKKMDKQPIVSVAPITSVTSRIPPVTSVRNSANVTAPLTTVPVTIVTTVVASSAAPTDLSDKSKKVNKGNNSKGPAKPGVSQIATARPIMPAPTTLASVTTYPKVTVSGPTPVGANSQLKPIQPKPTILGVASSVNPALAASLEQMKKESKKPKKKKKDKDKERSGHKKDKDHKAHTSVIKATTVTIPVATTLPPSGSDKEPVAPPTRPGQTAAPPELHRQTLQPPELDKQRLTPPELHKQQGVALKVPGSTETARNRPPSSLSLNSPLPTRPAEGEADDVHSPAYSDISDANDSVPVLENEVEDSKPSKDTPATPKLAEADKTNPADKPPVSADRGSVVPQSYNMYGNFYGQPPYLTPAIQSSGSPSQGAPGGSSHPTTPSPSSSSLPSPAQPSAKSAEDSSSKHAGKTDSANKQVVSVPGIKREHPSPSSQVPKDMDRQKHLKEAPPPHTGSPTLAKVGGVAPGSKDSHVADKARVPGQYPPGAQYAAAGYMGGMHGYMGGMDPSYMHLLATNPEYKAQHEKWLKSEQERRRHLQQETPVDMSAKSKSHPPPSTTAATTGVSRSQPSPSTSSSSTPAPSPGGLEARLRGLEVKKEVQDLSLKEKQNENRQILKENLELKAQMGESPGGSSGSGSRDKGGEDSKGLLERQREELQRFYLFQQQRMLEHSRHYMHGQQVKGSPGAGPVVGKVHPSTVSKAPSSEGSSPQQHQHQPSWRGESMPDKCKDIASAKASQESNSSMVHKDKPVVVKTEPEVYRAKAASQERIKTEPMSPSPGGGKSGEERRTPSSGSASSSVPPASTPYSHFYPHYAAGQLPFDPSHGAALFQAGMVPGYGSNAPYMHPSQIRLSGAEEDKQHKSLASPGAKTPEGSKALDLLQQRASQLYASGGSRGASPSAPAHKIHELKEAGKAGATEHARSGSPATKPVPEKPLSDRGTPPTGGKDDKGRGSPPTQRHLHTHHHTHVVGPPYPIYGPYPPVMTSPQGPGAPSMPPFISKP